MKKNTSLEIIGSTLNDLSDNLPKGRGRCFDIGSWGGCGVDCAAFVEGECGEPQDFEPEDIIDFHGKEDAQSIFEYYECFDDQV